MPTDDTTSDALEGLLLRLLPTVFPEPDVRERGRPQTIADAMLYAAVLVCTLSAQFTQRAVWRRLTNHGVWGWSRCQVSDDAIYQRLKRGGPAAMARLYQAVTAAVRDTPGDRTLAPFARMVVALDETTLDQTRRQGRRRHLANGADERIPGKLTTLYDLRRQLFRTVRLHPHWRQNEKVAAWGMVRTLPKRSLLVMDLGYFSFRWLDHLTKRKLYWVMRYREQTSFTVRHTYWEQDGSGEWLVWLGAHRADRAGGLVRLIAVRQGKETRRYLTNVLNPARFPAPDVLHLYAQRWNIERASNTLKTSLGVARPCSASWHVIQTQVYAALIIAQVIGHLRLQVAAAVGVPVLDVSLDLLLQEVPAFIARGEHPVTAIAELAKHGSVGGIIRPHSYRTLSVPVPALIVLPEVGLPRWRKPRYAGRRCGPGRGDRRPG